MKIIRNLTQEELIIRGKTLRAMTVGEGSTMRVLDDSILESPDVKALLQAEKIEVVDESESAESH
jgi:hypothetical protein